MCMQIYVLSYIQTHMTCMQNEHSSVQKNVENVESQSASLGNYLAFPLTTYIRPFKGSHVTVLDLLN